MTNGLVTSLPDKLYFRIGEVSDIVGVKPYVLRYWETEFSDIKPTKSKSGQRLYKKRDVEMLLQVKDLLYTERFTINGAKQRIKEVGRGELSQPKGQETQAKVVKKAEKSKPIEATMASGTTGTDKKFLEKIKNDMEWCLAELRSE